jgi:hypothetical protein
MPAFYYSIYFSIITFKAIHENELGLCLTKLKGSRKKMEITGIQWDGRFFLTLLNVEMTFYTLKSSKQWSFHFSHCGAHSLSILLCARG